jgi:hypothetical protein
MEGLKKTTKDLSIVCTPAEVLSGHFSIDAQDGYSLSQPAQQYVKEATEANFMEQNLYYQLRVVQLLSKFRLVTVPESSVLCSQVLGAILLQPTPYSSKIHFNTIFPSTTRSVRWSHSFRFRD